MQTLVVLGASGDLTSRLLLPGLGALLEGGADRVHLVGSARADWDDERWRRLVADSFAAGGASGPRVEAVAGSARYVRADVTAEEDLRRVLETCRGRAILYFALPPAITVRACRVLVDVGLPEGTRLVMEKPFGTDADSAAALNEVLERLVPEDRVFRVDHFLGMSTVLDIVGLRFANRMLEPLLNAQHVEGVDIVFDEALGLEGRAGYYDDAGALVDMVQSHLLQVLSLLAMEAPPTLEARDLRDGKALVLRATRVWDDDPVGSSRRARYSAGEVDGRRLRAYAEEEGVDPERKTETLAEVVLAVDTWRWAGVPFRMRSGKALHPPRNEILVTFRPPPRVPTGLTGYEQPDRLRIAFEPNRLSLDLNCNGAGDPSVIDRVTLEVALGPGDLPPYGQVLAGVLEGDPTLSVRGDTVVECWRILEPVLAAWRRDEVPLEEYPAGSAGPEDRPPAARRGPAP